MISAHRTTIVAGFLLVLAVGGIAVGQDTGFMLDTGLYGYLYDSSADPMIESAETGMYVGVCDTADTDDTDDSGDEPFTLPDDISGLTLIKTAPHPIGPNGLPIPGWKGQIVFPTKTPCNVQFWDDSDGVAPQTEGCHKEYHKWKVKNVGGILHNKCKKPTGAVFGEACLADGDTLIETNPGANECHFHDQRKGHPDVFSCEEHCDGVHAPGTGGRCDTVPNHCGPGKPSARCICGS